jgi:hypothetical protein
MFIRLGKTSHLIPLAPFQSPPLQKGRCEKIGSFLFHVIPAEAGIQCFQRLNNCLDPGFHRGDGLNLIFSQLQGKAGGFPPMENAYE